MKKWFYLWNLMPHRSSGSGIMSDSGSGILNGSCSSGSVILSGIRVLSIFPWKAYVFNILCVFFAWC